MSVIRDGEYRYREINRFRENAKGLLDGDRAAWRKRRRCITGEEDVNDPEDGGSGDDEVGVPWLRHCLAMKAR